MRDIGLTREEAVAEQDRLWALAMEQFELMAGIKSGDVETEYEGHYGYDPEYRAAETEKIRLLGEWTAIKESGVIPWVLMETGNRVDRDPDVWVSRIMATTYPSVEGGGLPERKIVKALRLTFTEEGRREHSLILNDRDILRKLVTQIEFELALWDEEA